MGSCIGMFFRLLIGFSLIGAGCNNFNISKDNKEIHKLTLQEITTSPPEKSKWIEVTGHLLEGSFFTEGNSEYAIIVDNDANLATYVKISENSSLKNHSGEVVTISGMATPYDKVDAFPKKSIGNDMRIGNLLIAENQKPPGWFVVWGLMIIGLMIMPWEKAGES